MCDTDQRLKNSNKCAPLSSKIVVNQVIGERSEQEAFDIHVCIPRRKPSAEQIINVFVKKLRITHVNVITNKVIVRGKFEIKAIYVGCLPCQPVHAVEIENVRFAVDLPILGARCGMEADAAALVEFIDYDASCGCDYKVRDDRYTNMYGKLKKQHINCKYDDECDDEDDCHHHHQDDCHDDCDDDCHKDHGHYYKDDCDDHCHKDHGHCCEDDCDDDCHKDHGHHHKKKHGHHQSCCCSPHKIKCSREFDVSVVLKVTAKVMVDRELMLNPVNQQGIKTQPKIIVYPQMPTYPKG